MTRQHLIAAFSALPLLAAGGLLYAGPLDPPAGPVAPTYKTLTEVEPRTAINATNTPGDATSLFKITQRGSYYLTGNITGVVGKHGVEIVASGVTLDLNGFDLVGIPAMGAFDGVSVTVAGLTNIAVVNGSVRNWGGDGVDLRTVILTDCRVEGVYASGNASNGISAGNGGTLANCSANSNTGSGFSTGIGCTLVNCSARSNTGTGISTSFGCTLTNCSATTNGGAGFTTSATCTLNNCAADANTGNGISTGAGCTVANCSASSNLASGINAATGTTVADCTARANTLDGILCSSGCVIHLNTCSGNGNGAGDGAGIHATQSDNRIEGNNCTGADRGIDVDAASNFIIKNTCSGNTTDWDILANNVYGPILDRRVPISAAVLGVSGPGSLGTTDPNANFTY